MPKPRKIISSSTIEDKQRKSLRANRSIGTSIEVIFGRLLYAAGVRYRKNDRKVCGSPDFTLPGLKIAVFCDGEFWHGRDWERKIWRTADLSVIFPIAHAGSIQQTSKNHFDRRTGRPVRAQTLALLVLDGGRRNNFARLRHYLLGN